MSRCLFPLVAGELDMVGFPEAYEKSNMLPSHAIPLGRPTYMTTDDDEDFEEDDLDDDDEELDDDYLEDDEDDDFDVESDEDEDDFEDA